MFLSVLVTPGPKRASMQMSKFHCCYATITVFLLRVLRAGVGKEGNDGMGEWRGRKKKREGHRGGGQHKRERKVRMNGDGGDN